MTVLAPTEAPDVAFRPSGHPVAWFVGVLSALVILLCVTWWAGLVTARVSVTGADPTVNRSAPNGEPYAINGYDLAVVNDGPLAVDVVGTGLTGAPARPISPVRLRPGQSAKAHVSLKQGDCEDRLLRVEVRSPAGIVRSVKVGRIHLGGLCPA
ncbi:MAG: hypothetical protein AVDCRST_MAG76-3831 [uncultured Acidimicrobiales bacterium]|uniref:Uncharacterized protein n=1 Tax=uncultured Acidimicrobiales bacterium TaxID=310071 RepID=A0A6J4JF45_9ACTN|nr:MAG: hypothetical protein AVDCRST_MAG76-3831 [uncultured Acidimicrobiales bacterium]